MSQTAFLKACLFLALLALATMSVYQALQVRDPDPPSSAPTGPGVQMEAATLRGQVATLKDELAMARQTLGELEQKRAADEKEIARLAQCLKDGEKQTADAAKDIARLAEALGYRGFRTDPTKDIVPDPPKANAGRGEAFRSKVVGVDKKLGLVIINNGRKLGVQKGNVLFVYRDAEYLGKAVVVDVTAEDRCAARYVREAMKKDPEVGDDLALGVEF